MKRNIGFLNSATKQMNATQPEPPVDFAGAARIFFRQTQKLIDTVAKLERTEIMVIIERHRDEHKTRAEYVAGAARDIELVKAECCEVILEDISTKESWANLPPTPHGIGAQNTQTEGDGR
jgi:hypothetical protein